MSQATGGDVPAQMPGPEAIAGAVLLADALQHADIDERTRLVITTKLAPVLPGQLVPPGTVVDGLTVTADQLPLLVGSAAVVAAGLDPAKTPSPPPPVLWTERGNRLLVHLAGVHGMLGTGLVEITIPVECDQTKQTDVTVTFVTGSADHPAGGVTTTEDHPRGAAIVVENWHEALIAFAWRILLIATGAMAGTGRKDHAGRQLIVNSFEVDAAALTVRPMARHTFLQSGTLP
jgi:hypothetical protein